MTKSISNAQSNQEHRMKWKALFFAFRCSLYLKQAIFAYKLKNKLFLHDSFSFPLCVFPYCSWLLEESFEYRGLISCAGIAWGYWRTQRTCLLHLVWNVCDGTGLMDWQTVGNTFEHFFFGCPMALLFEEIGLCCTAVHSPDYLYVAFCQVGLCEFLWALGRTTARAQPCSCARGMHLVWMAGLCH